MIYCDTSLLVSIITAETHSATARAWFFGPGRGPCAISDWSYTEVASALAKKHRNGFIDDEYRRVAETGWRALDAELDLLPVLAADFVRASMLVDAPPRGLRSGDALHLAVVLGRGHDLATFNHNLAAAARTLGGVVHPAP